MITPLPLLLLLIVANWQVVVEHAGDFPTPPAMPPKEVEVPLVQLLRIPCEGALPFPSSQTS